MAIIWKTAEDFETLVRQYPEQVEAGRRLARDDIEAGQLRFIFNDAVHYDLTEWSPEFHRLLKDRLGVDGFAWYKIEAPCFDAASVFQAEHYRCMVAEIEARFGAGILDDLVAEAQEVYRLGKVEQRGPS